MQILRARLLTALFGLALITPSLPTASPAAEQEPGAPPRPGVASHLWHGKTPTAQADEYYACLAEAGIKKIEATPGNRGVEVLRRIQGKVTNSRVETLARYLCTENGDR